MSNRRIRKNFNYFHSGNNCGRWEKLQDYKTMLEAKIKAEGEYDKFRLVQDKGYKSDFDKLVEEAKKK